jgi:hypothetical protein
MTNGARIRVGAALNAFLPLYVVALVLSVNAFIVIQRGLADAPGELPMWGVLALLTTTASIPLLANVRSERTRAKLTAW